MRGLGTSNESAIGPYRLVAEVGRGGMGRVLLGVTDADRLVAVKVVHSQFVEDEGFRTRFRREVAASRRVSGAYTAAVVDADPDAELPWLASVFVPGPSLKDCVDTVGPLPVDAALHLTAGLAEALADIHRSSLIHRDLKPSNVLLAADRPRVIDFGIARATDSEGGTEITHTGWLVGSPAFMSPEQAEGRKLTPASDVFSLGAVLAFACTGTSHFSGTSTPQTLYQVVHTEPDLTEVPEELRGLVRRCLAKDPAKRPDPAGILDVIGPLAPTERPWPASVHAMLDAQHTEVVRLLGRSEEDTVLLEAGAETVIRTVLSPGNTRLQAELSTLTSAPVPTLPAPRRSSRRTLLRGMLGVGVAATVVGAPIGIAAWSSDDSPKDGAGPKGDASPTLSKLDLIAASEPSDMSASGPWDSEGADISFSPDGSLVAVGGDGGVRLLYSKGMTVAASLEFDIPGGSSDLVFSPDGSILAGAVLDEDADTDVEDIRMLWNTETYKKIAVLTDPVPANIPGSRTPRVFSVAFSRDGAILASGHSFNGLITLWDTTSHRKIASLKDPDEVSGVRGVVFARDGRTLISATESSGYLRFWDLAEHKVSSSVWDARLTSDDIALSPDGNLVAATAGSVAIAWDTATRKKRGTFTFEGAGELFTLAFSPDGRALIAVSVDTDNPSTSTSRRIHVWDVATQKRTHEFRDVIDDSNAIALSPDGRMLVTVHEGNVCAWKLPGLV